MDQEANHDRSLADLGRRLSNQTTELVRHEVELAKAKHCAVKGKRAGVGVSGCSAAPGRSASMPSAR